MSTITGPASTDPRALSRHRLPISEAGRHRIRRWLAVALAGLLVVELWQARSWLASAGDAIADSSWRALIVAAAAATASMVCFGAVRQQTLRSAGVPVKLRRAVAMSYAAGAIHTTLPGGAVFSTAYAFRRLRDWGASTAVATWCMAVTGVVATATLAVVGMSGILLGGGVAVPATQLTAEILAMLVVLTVIAQLTRHPERLQPAAQAGLRVVNRLRHRPQTTGYRQLASLIGDLRTIEPSERQWAVALLLSLGNWLFDAACLAACCSALGLHISVPGVLLTYTAGMAAASVSPVPAGLGMVEGALLFGLTAAGAPAAPAIAAILVYRLLSTGGVTVVGWLILGVQRRSRTRASQSTAEGQLTVTDLAKAT